MLLIDNAHCADRSSLQLLEYFCRQLVQGAVVVLLSYRPSEVPDGHPLRATLSLCSRAARFEEIELPGLDRAEAAELMRSLLGVAPSATLVDAICRRSDGNPLFVSQVTASLARRAGGGASLGADVSLEVPLSLKAVIGARLAALEPATLELLETAAIIGRDFGADMLAALAGLAPLETLARLEPAVAAGVAAQVAPGTYRFAHALFREVLYAEHTLESRVRLHGRAMRRLEQARDSERADWLPQLAYHAFESAPLGHAGEAIEYCRRAAAQASAGRAFGEAAAQLERALQLAGGAGTQPELRFDLLMALGEAQFPSGQSDPAAHSYLRAAVLAQRERWWARLPEAVLALQNVQGQLGLIHVASVPLHHLALEQLPRDATALRARLLASLASACRREEDRPLGLRWYDESIALAREVDDPRVLVECLNQALLVLQPPRDAPRQAQLLREALALAERTGTAEDVLAANSAVLFPLSKLGEYAELQQLLQRLHARADAARHPHYRQVAAGFEAQVALLQGRWADALRWARASLQQAELDGSTGVEGRFGFQMFAIQRALGNLASVAPLLAQLAGDASQSRLWLPGQILLHCEVGQFDAARRLLDRLGDAAQLPRDDLYETALVYLAEACAMLGDLRRCETLYEALRPYRSLNLSVIATVALGSGAGVLALLAAKLRRGREARELYEEALAFHARIGAPPLLARTQVDYAELLAASDRPADLERASQLRREARAIADRLGMRRLLERVDALCAGEATAGTLTERELDVLRHMAAGASNKRIAQQLAISVTTVATHIRSILRKTGARNRTEATAQARRSNLIPAE